MDFKGLNMKIKIYHKSEEEGSESEHAEDNQHLKKNFFNIYFEAGNRLEIEVCSTFNAFVNSLKPNQLAMRNEEEKPFWTKPEYNKLKY